MQMDVHKTLYRLFFATKNDLCYGNSHQNWTSLAAMFTFHSCFISCSIQLHGLLLSTAVRSHCLPTLLAKDICVQQSQATKRLTVMVVRRNVSMGETRAGLRGGHRGQLPRDPDARRPPWWNLFVSNKILVWKFFVIQKRYKTTTLYYCIFLCSN